MQPNLNNQKCSSKINNKKSYAVKYTHLNKVNGNLYRINSQQRAIHKNLISYQNQDTIILKLEITNLERRITENASEKAEIEKLLSDFHHQHTQELSGFINQLIQLRKIVHRYNPQKLEEIEKDEQAYNEQLQADNNKTFHELSIEQKKQLKVIYRKASQLCHPDRVAEALKESAQEIFIKLTQAYQTNDLARVQELFTEIRKGVFRSGTDSILELDKLKTLKDSLQLKLNNLKAEVIELKENETYKMVTSIPDWTTYFTQVKEQLIDEIATIKTVLDSDHL